MNSSMQQRQHLHHFLINITSNMKTIYIVTWKSGTGKWTFCEYFLDRKKSITYKPSSLTARILQEFNIPETRENYSKMMHVLRDTFTQDIYVFAAYEFIEKYNDKQIIMDGIRKISFIRKIKERYECKVIYIESDNQTRWNRIKNRGEKDNESEMSFEEFLKEDSLKSEKELDEIRLMADIIIENNGSKESFLKQINNIYLVK